MYAKLVFSIPVNKHYYYSIPEDLEDIVKVGYRVKVDFNNRDTYGYVIEITDKIDSKISLKDIKSVLDIIDEHPIFNDNILNLANWISSYYFTALGETLKLMTPAVCNSREYVFEDLEPPELIMNLKPF